MLDKILTAIGKFSYRFRYLVLAFGVLLFISAAILQSFAKISYSYVDYSKILEIFPAEDTLVIVYDNFDEDKIPDLATKISQDEHVTSVQAYATTLGMQMNSAQLSDVAGIAPSFIETLLYIRENGIETNGMTIKTFIDFLTSDTILNNELFKEQIDESSLAQLTQLKTIIDAVIANESYNAQSLASLLGVEPSMVRTVFMISLKEEMTVEEFVSSAINMSSKVSQSVSPEQLAGLKTLESIVNLTKANCLLSPAKLVNLFTFESQSFNESTVKLLYVFYYASLTDMSQTQLSIYDFFCFIADKIVPNEVFSVYFDDNTKEQILTAKQTMEDGKAQLLGEGYSRMIITLNHEMESQAMYNFYKALELELNEKFVGVYYLVGNSAMSNELSKTFQSEYLLISIITAIAIFIVVCLTFKKISISLILVAVIECAVFITMSTMVLANSAMYFIALIIVQCILMGAMVDYGILFTNYYVEVRKEYSVKDALPEVLKRSIRAIATSAVILILITFTCGMIMKGAVSSILQTLCVGSSAALFLVIFILPSLLAIFDKLVVKQKK